MSGRNTGLSCSKQAQKNFPFSFLDGRRRNPFPHSGQGCPCSPVPADSVIGVMRIGSK